MAKKAAKSAGKSAGKRKRTVSGKRGRPGRSRQSKAVDPRGVIGIAVLCLGLLALFSQFIPSGGGFLNSIMLIARGLGGTLCLLLPVVVCWAGVVLVFFGERRMSLRTLICGALIFLFVETMFQLFQVSAVRASAFADGVELTYPAFLARSYKLASLDCKGGGFIGALLAWPLFTALDVWGGMIVLIFATTIVLMVLTGVTFTGAGMRLSEWLDDLRADWAERREEQTALRAAQEEETLARENALAEERQKRRAARKQAEQEAKLQAEREAQAEAAARQEAQRQAAAQQTEQEETAPRRKGKAPELTVVRPQEPASAEPDMPLPPRPQDRPPKRAAAPRRRTTIPDSTPLYIERDDEFTRAGIDERSDPHGARRRAQFTIAEAEDAFLHGVNQDAYAGYGDTQPSPYAQPSGYGEQSAYAQPSGYGEQSAYAQPSGYGEQSAYAQPSGYGEQSAYAQPSGYGEQSAYAQPSGYGEQSAYAPQGDEAEQTAYGEPGAYARPEAAQEETNDEEDAITSAHAPGAERPIVEYDDGDAQVVTGGSFGGWRADGARETSGSRQPDSPLARSLQAASQRAQQNQPPQGQNVLSGAQEQQTIVQLRGNRLDGTPLVVPKKDTHEAPQAQREAYVYPPIDLLNQSSTVVDPNQRAKDEAGAQKLLGTLESFGVQAKLIHVTHGPAITRYELQPAPGVKVSRIVGLVDDIALNMASDGVRIEAPIPGKPAVGIEIPNQKIETVSLRDVLQSQEMMRAKSPTAVALGKGISGAPVVADMAKMPHVLIAGATGSGKSVCINTIINSIIFRASPREVRLILIDPKVVELSVYNGIPHLLVPVVTDPKKASAALSWAVVEMEHRYKRFETMGVRDIRGYNAAIGPDEEPMSKIIVIIDELADLMMVAPGEVEESICRLAQLARAAGIHLVIATQRPSVNVITGVIKANIPSRIAFAVSSQIDSRTILDSGGAEKLLGKGDMLYAPQGASKPTRVQGCFVSDDEVQRIVDFVRGKHTAEYNEDVIEQMDAAADEDKAAAGDAPNSGEPVDEMLSKAIDLAVEAGQVSISMLQRRLRVGYARAGRLVDEMTLRGITAEAEGPTKPRTVLISREEWRRMQENQE